MGYFNTKNKNAQNIRVRARAFTNLSDHADTSEKEIEKHLRRRAKDAGMLCLKYANATEAGYPDRVLLLPEGKVIWVELKSKGCKPTRVQLARHSQLRAIGHEVYVVDSRDGVDKLINFFRDDI